MCPGLLPIGSSFMDSFTVRTRMCRIHTHLHMRTYSLKIIFTTSSFVWYVILILNVSDIWWPSIFLYILQIILIPHWYLIFDMWNRVKTTIVIPLSAISKIYVNSGSVSIDFFLFLVSHIFLLFCMHILTEHQTLWILPCWM